LEAEGLLNTRVVFDGEIVEVFQAARSLVRVPLVAIQDVRLEQGRKWTEMKIETTAGRVLTPDRRPLPIDRIQFRPTLGRARPRERVDRGRS
jgi:hypothetical protein